MKKITIDIKDNGDIADVTYYFKGTNPTGRTQEPFSKQEFKGKTYSAMKKFEDTVQDALNDLLAEDATQLKCHMPKCWEPVKHLCSGVDFARANGMKPGKAFKDLPCCEAHAQHLFDTVCELGGVYQEQFKRKRISL